MDDSSKSVSCCSTSSLVMIVPEFAQLYLQSTQAVGAQPLSPATYSAPFVKWVGTPELLNTRAGRSIVLYTSEVPSSYVTVCVYGPIGSVACALYHVIPSGLKP